MKTYEIILHTLSPVYIGSGTEMKKKEYIFSREDKKVYIPNWRIMYEELRKKGLEEGFIKFFLTNQDGKRHKDRESLYTWLIKNGISENEYKEWTLYEMDCGDFLEEKGEIGIQTFLKDAYGMPYVPGSSIKGMLRTILLIYEMHERPNQALKSRSNRSVKAAIEKVNLETQDKNSIADAKKILKDVASDVETEYFHTLRRKRDRLEDKADPINDCMAGIIVSDSQPLRREDMVLCPKIDVRTDQTVNEIDILRECLKPETDIRFQIGFMEEISPYDIEDVREAIKFFNNYYYEAYLKYFAEDRPAEHTVWLGGGTGFLTKTITHLILDEKDRVKNTAGIFQVVLPESIYEEHLHNDDISLGISPHMLKCTRYEGKRYQMGQCEFKKAE